MNRVSLLMVRMASVDTGGTPAALGAGIGPAATMAAELWFGVASSILGEASVFLSRSPWIRHGTVPSSIVLSHFY